MLPPNASLTLSSWALTATSNLQILGLISVVQLGHFRLHELMQVPPFEMIICITFTKFTALPNLQCSQPDLLHFGFPLLILLSETMGLCPKTLLQIIHHWVSNTLLKCWISRKAIFIKQTISMFSYISQ